MDYKQTVFLPQTSFSMKAGLPQLEPKLLARWKKMELYKKLRGQSQGRPLFILHDGPPYANGHLHMGHALNKSLKDVVVRSQQMEGKDAPFVPGWDCHGLPIEAKVEEQYRAKKISKDQVPVKEFRQSCRSYAAQWVQTQSEEFQRLGCAGQWDQPYLTMDYKAEAEIVRQMGKFLEDGSLYLGTRPIMWSVVEQTALAEAEIEYQDHTSLSIYLGFPVKESSLSALEGAQVIIWTTTVWTIPANRAIAYGPEFSYSLVQTSKGRFLVASELVSAVLGKMGLADYEVLEVFQGAALEKTFCAHPLAGRGYDFRVPLLEADHVTLDTGTGFVHTAPGHGVEDFALGKAFGIEVPYTVQGDGIYAPGVPLFAGTHVFKASEHVLPALEESGYLWAQEKIVHSYPHSWRSKAPLIYRTTPQWFVSMDKTGLRDKALKAIDKVSWYPKESINRIRTMVENRPDWCVSRQRAWGTPIPVFLHKQTQKPLIDGALIERIAEAIEKEGADIWFDQPEARFLPPLYDPSAYEAVQDIVDVWFDAGSTQAFVLRQDPSLQWPADLYLEGSDQHRGWFQSSLLVACGTEGSAPFKNVLTHGFLVDEQGRKMSKSLGNTVNLEDVLKNHGADILRLWAVSSDYTQDLRIGPGILKQQEDVYRRLRNTFRYLLGSLGTKVYDPIAYEELPELERWVLARLAQLDEDRKRFQKNFDYQQLMSHIHNFCATDLSAFYFDIRKDSLYCDGEDSLERRSVLTVLQELFSCLVKWLAPILCFTAEEAWMTRYPGEESSVHLELFPEIPALWFSSHLLEKMERIRQLRRLMTGALEIARAGQMIGSSLQAQVEVVGDLSLFKGLEDVDWSQLSIASAVTLSSCVKREGEFFQLEDLPALGARVSKAPGDKCERCWKVLPEVSLSQNHLCLRCEGVVVERGDS